MYELHLAAHLRRQQLGSHFLSAVRAHGVGAKRQGLLLTCHLANQTALRCRLISSDCHTQSDLIQSDPIDPRCCSVTTIAGTRAAS